MAQTLNQIVNAAIGTAVADSNATQAKDQVSPAGQPNPQPPRSFASPMDSYEQDVGYDSPFGHFAPGARRAMWQIPDVALTHTPVNTLQSSGTPTSTQTNQIIGGVVGGVKAPAANKWGAVPNMQNSVVSTGPMILTATLSVQSTSATDSISFAFYRDAVQIGQIFTQTTSSTANKQNLVNLSSIDVPPTGSHVYALYWRAGTGTLSTTGTARSFFAINLQPN